MRSVAWVVTAMLISGCARAPVGGVPATTAPAAAPAASVPATPAATGFPRDAAATERPAEPLTTLFVIPVPNGVVPTQPELLPGSQRSYRGGFHEGIDFPAKVGTPVRAAAPGTVSRVDYAYQEWSEPARNAALDNARRLGYTPELVLDLIRGRQVWVDHGAGVVTRYAHLSTVAPLRRGDPVSPGTVLGEVGSSGYPEGGAHLHFEIRRGESYMGAGMDVVTVRGAVARAFGTSF